MRSMASPLLLSILVSAVICSLGCRDSRIAHIDTDADWDESLSLEIVFQWLSTKTHRHYVLDPELVDCRIKVPPEVLHDPFALLTVIEHDYAVRYDHLVDDGTTWVVPMEKSAFYDRFKEPPGSGLHIRL